MGQMSALSAFTFLASLNLSPEGMMEFWEQCAEDAATCAFCLKCVVYVQCGAIRDFVYNVLIVYLRDLRMIFYFVSAQKHYFEALRSLLFSFALQLNDVNGYNNANFVQQFGNINFIFELTNTHPLFFGWHCLLYVRVRVVVLLL